MRWISSQTQQLYSDLSELFTAPIFGTSNNRVSLSSIALLILLVLVAFLAARIIREWLRRRVLNRLGLDRGTQEAVATIIGYLLSALSFAVILQTAGFNLSSLAVLAGVLGIGFGFGLQNLASNFISGLTLLFEQPIKVGDFVEVDGLLGTVEKIAIRSTIVRTPDDVFVIVPNNRFAENNIINWSYGAPRCRIHLPVGVAYGTDPVLVTEALSSAARIERRVLSSPSPKVWFRDFGDSALKFELLVWIDQPQDSEPIKSSLYFLIEQELRHRGIKIPFPQRDLHIHNLKELGALFQGQSPTAELNNGALGLQTPPPTDPPIPKLPDNWNLRDLLRRVTYFEQCTDSDLRVLIEQGYRQLFPAGQVICHEKDPGESFYIILSGAVEVLSQRVKNYIATLHAGEFFGEISLLTGTPRTATVRALEDTVLFVVNRHDLQQLLSSHRDLAEQIAQKLSERQQALLDLGLLDASAMRSGNETPLERIRKRIQSLFEL